MYPGWACLSLPIKEREAKSSLPFKLSLYFDILDMFSDS